MTISKEITQRIKDAGARFHASDNISQFVSNDDLEKLIDEISVHFEQVLQALIIDTETDENSAGTARRLAKMYVKEIMKGRYYPAPDAASFPNTGEHRYDGMLVVRSEIHSVCSHHHQPVHGVAYIGVIPGKRVIGLSKYTRIAQWCARRGTLQEELTNKIAQEISAATESDDVGVYMKLKHGCCSHRGIMANDSTTQTTVLFGAFKTDASTKKEFFDNIQIQETGKCK
jgi:GTP cyclohydrolase IA